MSDPSTEQPSDVKFEIGHVLFIDIVGYSQLLINKQSEQLETLRQIVRGTEQFRAAEAEGKLLRLPTGDGGALVFRNTPEASVLCALEISKALKSHPELRVRMGIHSGPVNAVTDLNEQANIAGAGINIAQRVMDCGDAGHILLSRHVAEDLESYPRWQPYLHELGECEVKHGVKVSLVNLYTDDAGNAALPEKFRNAVAESTAPPPTPGKRFSPVAVGAVTLAVIAILAALFLPRVFHSPEKESISNSPNESATGPISAKSIAVLPFENLSDDKSNAYFAEGIQDEILTRLAKIADLKVISRTSTQKYKSTPDNLRDVGRQLGVANVLEGSVQKIANAVHVNVQLIRAATDEHLWAESYNRTLDDVFGVEGEVATTIAQQLNTKLTGSEEKALATKPTTNSAAYDAYLHGRSVEATRVDIPGEQEAAADYAKAVQLDPTFALAWAHLADVRSFLYFNAIERDKNSPAAVKEAADRASALDPQLGEGWLAQGAYRYRVLADYPGALQAYEEAIRRLPNSTDAFGEMAFVERRMGRWDASEAHFRKALQLDPRNLQLLIYTGETLGYMRRFGEAEEFVDRALQIAPNAGRAIFAKASLFQAEGRLADAAKQIALVPSTNGPLESAARATQLSYERRFDEAIAEIQINFKPTKPGDPLATAWLSFLGYFQERVGKSAEARATFESAVQQIKPSPNTIVPVDQLLLPCVLALSYAGLGDKENALATAREAVSDYQRDSVTKPQAEVFLAQIEAQLGDADAAIAAIPHLLEVPAGITPALLRYDPLWDPLRKDPRFQKLSQEPNK